MISSATSTSSGDSAVSEGLSQSDKINIGVGLGMGLVTLVGSIILTIWANKNRPGWTKDLRILFERPRQGGSTSSQKV
jgi:hypothetical protein